jgi:hypothetical protein
MGRMSSVEEIKAAIDKLSIDDRARLERLLHRWTDDEWDRQIAAYASAGRLDDVLDRVDRAIDSGQLRDLP